jgi:hypothetical protein
MATDKEAHPFTAKLTRGGFVTKQLVRMPDNRLRWRTPRWRNGDWYVRDQYGWRKLLSIGVHIYAGNF